MDNGFILAAGTSAGLAALIIMWLYSRRNASNLQKMRRRQQHQQKLEQEQRRETAREMQATLRRRHTTKRLKVGQSNATNVADESPYRAVTISCPTNTSCCWIVRKLRGKRYLVSEAPKIPLPGCDSHKCTCQYIKHSDRRIGDRRASDPRYSITGIRSDRERRSGKERRRTGRRFVITG